MYPSYIGVALAQSHMPMDCSTLVTSWSWYCRTYWIDTNRRKRDKKNGNKGSRKYQ